MTKDIDALVAAADALAEAMIRIEDLTQHDMGMSAAEERVIHFEAQSALTQYRAAREAVRKGTPPAFAGCRHD